MSNEVDFIPLEESYERSNSEITEIENNKKSTINNNYSTNENEIRTSSKRKWEEVNIIRYNKI